jgi:hypothetical protein
MQQITDIHMLDTCIDYEVKGTYNPQQIPQLMHMSSHSEHSQLLQTVFKNVFAIFSRTVT